MSNPTYGSSDPGPTYTSDSGSTPDPAYTTPDPGYTTADPGYTTADPGYTTPDPGYAPDPGYSSAASSGYVSDVAEVPPVYAEPVPTYDTAGSYSTDTPSTADVAKDEAAAVKDTAKDEAANVKDTALEAGRNVAGTAKEEVANVAGEAGAQAKNLLGTAASELQSQAGTQQTRLASTVRSYADELHGMVSKTDGSGPLTDLAHQAASKGSEIAQWLEDREPRDVLDEVRSFARRRPGLFLLLCGAAGVVAGRITRGAVAVNTSVDSPKPGRALETTSAVPAAPDYYADPAPVASYPPVTPAATSYDTTPTYGEYADAPLGYPDATPGQAGYAR